MWFLLWAALLIGAGVVFWLLGRRLYRKGKALSTELTVASDRLAEVSAALAELEQANAARTAATAAGPAAHGRPSRRRGGRR
jgi:hypothetical protein